MSLLEKIQQFFSPKPKSDPWAAWVEVKCSRCGEIIRARIDLRNDLSVEYGEREEDTTYFCRKTLIGAARCYNPVEIELTFDRHHRLIAQKARGGEFLQGLP